MKYIITCLLVCFVFTAFSQTTERYHLQSNGGLCTGTIVLYPNYTYLYEHGCEPSSFLSFGKWIQRKDTLKLQPVNPRTYQVIKDVAATTVPGDSIWLILLDRDGVNMSSKISTGLEVAGRGSYIFSNDSSGTKKFVYRRSGGKILFRTLNKLFGQRLELPTDSANHFIVTLNVASDWITSTHADWSNANPMLLVKKGNALIIAGRTTEVFLKQ